MANGSRPVSTFTAGPHPGAAGPGRRRAHPADPRLGPDLPGRLQEHGGGPRAPARHLSVIERHGRLVGARQLARAKATFGSYASLHSQIRHDDLGGNLSGAVALASGSQRHDLPAISSDLNGDLADGITGLAGDLRRRHLRAPRRTWTG